VPSEKNPLNMEIHIRVDFEEGAKFTVQGCDGECKVYDTRVRTWRHLNFFQYRCYVQARVPRVITPRGENPYRCSAMGRYLST
jgi:transposase